MKKMNIYVGNLAYTMSEEDLKEAFGAFGSVDSARIIMDRETNRSKGFGFVEMSDDSAARSAIEALNEEDLQGRKLVVNEARPREPRGGGGGGGYGRGGGGGGGGGYGGGGGGGGGRRF
jgi:cold-inducible RNA-binding protein